MIKLLFLLTATLLVKTSGFHLSPSHTKPSVVPVHHKQSKLFVASNESKEKTDNLPVPTLPSWDPVNWTPQRLHNSPLFRSAAILSVLALAGRFTPAKLLSAQTAGTLHVLAFATWFGTTVYTTFIAGITMFKNLPRQTFGTLQSKLFPKYFMLSSVTILLQMLTLNSLPSSLGRRSTIALGMAMAMSLLNQFILEPRSTKIMFRRYDMENEGADKESEEYKTLAKNFGKFHGMGSLTNLIALCGAVAHGCYLGAALAI